MTVWHLAPTISAPMSFQMALDERLFRNRLELHRKSSSAPPLVRFYYSAKKEVTVGYSFKMSLRNDTVSDVIARVRSTRSNDENQKMTIPVTRRITGGGIVEHGQDLIFSLIAAKTDDESFRSVRLSYLKIHEAVKSALEALGKAARFYRCDENLPRGPECFRYPIATDLAVDGRKSAGGAQKRSAGVLLHQESIQLPRGVRAKDLQHTLTGAFEEKFKMKYEKIQLDPWVLRRTTSGNSSG